VTDESAAGRLYEIKIALEDLERELAQREVAWQALRDFKIAVDHVRLSVWAMLTAERPASGGVTPDEASVTVARFRLARATELLGHVRADMEARIIAADTPEVLPFRTAVEATVSQLKKLR
jgi:hypothetical protein